MAKHGLECAAGAEMPEVKEVQDWTAEAKKQAVRGEISTREGEERHEELQHVWNRKVEWQFVNDTMPYVEAHECERVHGMTDWSRMLLEHLVEGAGSILEGRKHMIRETRSPTCAQYKRFQVTTSSGELLRTTERRRKTQNGETCQGGGA